METAILSKRVWIFIMNMVLYHVLGFAAALPFLLIIHLHVALYILIGIGFSILISLVFNYLILTISRGYTLASALLGVKFVSSDGKKLNQKQIAVRSIMESIAILAFFDFIYFVKNRTERGVIDRVSDSFAIDIRL